MSTADGTGVATATAGSGPGTLDGPGAPDVQNMPDAQGVPDARGVPDASGTPAGGGAGSGPVPDGGPAGRAPASRAPGAVRAWLRLLGSEAGLTFRRPRNLAMLAVLGVIPVLVGVAMRLFAEPIAAEAGDGPGNGGAIFAQITGNGLFLTFAALSVLVQLMLPVAVAVVAGDAVAGEAGGGTLRYLLTAPAGRTRLLAAKYGNAVLFCLAAVSVIALSALVTGLALFPAGPITLLSGTTIPFAEGLLRIGLVVLYVTAGMAALAAVALALSTLTEVAIGAIAATVVTVVVVQVLGVIPQLAWLQPYLLTQWWNGFDGVLRDPVAVAEMGQGLLVFAAYTAVFGSIAWARFTGKDITA
ncbi:ABC transporter permease [Planomonospora venezuelensis]|uniref:ABC-2 type transport system permease protein n=1 Tax=Planomonospora venezuelensis TaxID=1999 RepID=A0A841DGT6_PLAVE|nr:ABC transporter permease [Planomonospora venezuelensis]MBB5966406.1 ABC-2 type transport system permease protein [Planomonospora venezuelensis]GIN02769.1 ABC transporter permease [Planomonospora venezuelensis]